ncbi:surface antigen Bsp, putative [Trichomonas vaginalis G3]|uniref:Surface antigen Bsp, putative n=1 Tax=Trichomonas vaginalis (strain ATCC PRA-98 / G3) TaxID=412133 RepID=A2EG25_TRIV3|nr:ribonuclease inhibitor domain-containing protein [Trichomonas vaginalis G3]EAY08386.1 surface antigen Bsp, putative [Trichomonas vaginalis G3]KAI5499334.1 ribonuclease inhibitor domain-containing protein [Trichomonas vaginalis G3]|eukprot:XP_001320609.1 surface antigen Bsp [Trichomonas vaginalis G3]
MIIEEYTFYNCTNLEFLSNLYNLTTIKSYAFYNCYNLKNISNLNNLTTLGYSVFYNCSSLKELHCLYSLKNIKVNYDDKYWNSFYYESPFKGSSFEYLYDLNSLEIIPDYAFYKCDKLKGIYNLTKLTSIGKQAFRYCYNLTDINTMSHLISIGELAFSSCSKFNGTLDFYNDVNISQYAFSSCHLIKEVIFRGSIISVQSYSFSQIANISIYHPIKLYSTIVNNKENIDIYYYGKAVPLNDTGSNNLIYSIASNVYVLCDYKSTEFYGHEVKYLSCKINKLTKIIDTTTKISFLDLFCCLNN